MTLEEGQNLYVVGINNILKVSSEALKLEKFQSAINDLGLKDNNLKCVTIKDSIAASDKALYHALLEGGIILLALLIIIFYSVISLSEIWQTVYGQQILIQRFLGYTKWDKYCFIFLVVISIDLLAMITGIITQSLFVLVGFMLIFLLELFVINRNIKR